MKLVQLGDNANRMGASREVDYFEVQRKVQLLSEK
jgi:hypothetical protein